MRLLRSTDLALRVLMRLAVAGAASPTTRQVAADMDVPYTHAAKVVAELQHLGLVDARRGRGGGLTLTEQGRTASVGALVRTFEGTGDVVDWGTTPCPVNYPGLRSRACTTGITGGDAAFASSPNLGFRGWGGGR
ncbi:RrF2 family transcriptional regulator [Streptomyces cellostaticus]|uniref:RrF2 family transcriptional regulator n=1 Tax=Streptomyces cellostaticus TaxID=67285 RepID=UPI00099EA66C